VRRSEAKDPMASDRLKNLLKHYGKVGLGVYCAIFVVVYLGFLISISAGVGETDTAATVTTAGAAWLATKLTQPLRIGATFLLTPLVARLFKRKPAGES
jgi:hypothetical protein